MAASFRQIGAAGVSVVPADNREVPLTAGGGPLAHPLPIRLRLPVAIIPRMIPTGETRRLWLRPLTLSDAPQIQAEFPRWEIVRFLQSRVPWPYPPDGALHFIREIALPAMERGEAWHWTLRLKTQPDRIIGTMSLMRTGENHRGFWLLPAHQGQGLMSEACEWATDFWFDVLGFPRLRVSKAAANLPSRRISLKQGMRKVSEEESEFVSGKLTAEIWEITAEEWQAWKRRRVEDNARRS